VNDETAGIFLSLKWLNAKCTESRSGSVLVRRMERVKFLNHDTINISLHF
jgi:hypothetical protein